MLACLRSGIILKKGSTTTFGIMAGWLPGHDGGVCFIWHLCWHAVARREHDILLCCSNMIDEAGISLLRAFGKPASSRFPWSIYITGAVSIAPCRLMCETDHHVGLFSLGAAGSKWLDRYSPDIRIHS